MPSQKGLLAYLRTKDRHVKPLTKWQEYTVFNSVKQARTCLNTVYVVWFPAVRNSEGVMPRGQYLTVTISKDDHGRKFANVCPACKRRISEGYYYLELREQFASKTQLSLGAVGADIPIAPICCGIVIDYIQLHPTMEEALDRRERLDTTDRRKLRHIKVFPPKSLMVIV